MDKYNSETEEEYFYEVFNWMPEDVISDEYYEKNSDLFQDITGIMYDYNAISGKMPTSVAKKSIEMVFRCILKHGLR